MQWQRGRRQRIAGVLGQRVEFVVAPEQGIEILQRLGELSVVLGQHCVRRILIILQFRALKFKVKDLRMQLLAAFVP